MRNREDDTDEAALLDLEVLDWYSNEEDEYEELEEPPKRGRAKILPQWSRVLSIHRPELIV